MLDSLMAVTVNIVHYSIHKKSADTTDPESTKSRHFQNYRTTEQNSDHRQVYSTVSSMNVLYL